MNPPSATLQGDQYEGENPHLDWAGEPLVVMFFVALEHPLMLPEGLSTFANRTSESVPWIEFNRGHNFVALKIWRREVERLHDYKFHQSAFDVMYSLLDSSSDPDSSDSAPAPDFDPDPDPDPDPEIQYGNVQWPLTTFVGAVMELATPLIPTEENNISNAISDAFDRSIEELESLSLAYQSATKDHQFRPVTRQTCPPSIPFCFQRRRSAEYFANSLFFPNDGARMPHEPEELSEAQQREFELFYRRRKLMDPFSAYSDWSRRAHQSLNLDGDYAYSVIATSTAMEVLVNTVLLMCSWESGHNRSESRNWFENETRFQIRTRKHLCPLVGGNWSLADPGSIPSLIKTVSSYRNIIVHQGRTPPEFVAKHAMEAKSQLERALKDRLAARRLDFLAPACCS